MESSWQKGIQFCNVSVLMEFYHFFSGTEAKNMHIIAIIRNELDDGDDEKSENNNSKKKHTRSEEETVVLPSIRLKLKK